MREQVAIGLLWAVGAFLATPGSAQEAFSFGALAGSDLETFGEITDLDARDGLVAVTDALVERIVVIRTADGHAAAFGREGDGPREFRHLRSVAVADGGTITALDAGHRRIVRLSLDGDSLRWEGDVRLPLLADQHCVLGGRLFVTSFTERGFLHEVDGTGEVISSFGEPAMPETSIPESSSFTEVVRRYGTSGTLLCDSRTGLLVMVPSLVGEVRAFRTDGRLVWARELDPFFQASMATTSEGRFRMAPNPESGTAHKVVSAWLGPQARLHLHLVEERLGEREPRLTEMRVLKLVDGSLTETRQRVPRLSAHAGSIAIGFETDPYPRVFGVEWSPGPELER